MTTFPDYYFEQWEKEFFKLTEMWQEGDVITPSIRSQMNIVEDLAILVDLYCE